MAGADDEPVVSSSPLVRLLKALKRLVFSKAAPIADTILFIFLVFLLSVAGHTFQDVYGTRQLTETWKHRLVGVTDASAESSRWPTSNSLNHTDFKDISSHDNFWNYIQYNLADTIYAKEFYDGGDIPADQAGLVLGHNVMVQRVRIRQKRVKETECQTLPARLRIQSEAGLMGQKCFPKYSKSLEDRGMHQGVEWTSAEMLALKPRNELQHKFQGGSFMIELPTGNAAFKQAIQKLKDGKWTDRATRAVFLDFCVLNLSRDQFVSVRYLFDFTEYGKIVPKVTIRAYRDRLDHGLLLDALNYVSEAALYGTAMANAVREVGRLRIVGPNLYFSNVWNIVISGVLACIFLSMYYRVAIVRSQWNTIQGLASTEMRWELDASNQYNVKWDWDDLGEGDTLIIKLQAIGMVLAYIKIFSFLQFFSSKIDDFITSLSHSKQMLIAYISIMVIFIMSFSIGLYLAFGVAEFQFSSLPLSALSLTELLFGNFDAQPLSAEQGLLASLLLVGFFAILAMVSMSAILALVNWATREVHDGKVERETDDKDTNLKHQLSAGVKRLIMSEYLGPLGRGLRSLVEKPRDLQYPEDEEDEMVNELEDEVVFTMVNASKFALKGLIGSVTELRDSVREMCEGMGVDYDEDQQGYRRENWWRKFRNEYQEDQFRKLLDAVRSEEPSQLTDVIRSWKRLEHAGQGHTTDINWRDTDGFSALHHASLMGNADLVMKLIDLKADPNARNDDGNSCVHLAALSGQLNNVRVLVEHGYAEVDNVVNNASFTPLHMAAYAGHTPICKYLGEELESDVVCQTGEGLTPLHLAVIQHHDETVEYMSNTYSDALNVRANGGETPLHVAVLTNNDVHLIRILLKAGAKVGEKMYDGVNVYQVSVNSGRELAVQRVLHRVLSMGDSYQRAFPGLDERAAGMSLIKFACMGMHREMEELLQEGADIDAVQPGAGTALHAAVKRRMTAMVEFLVDAGASVHTKDADGLTPVQVATVDGYFDGYELMANSLTFEALPIDNDGNSLLHLAVRAGKSMQMVQHLINHHKIDPMSCNKWGQTCYDVANLQLEVNAQFPGEEGGHGLHEKFLHYFNGARDEYEDSVRQPLMPGETLVATDSDHVQVSKRVIRFFENINGLQKDAKAYARLFAENEIDFDGLTLVKNAHLVELGIVKLGIRNKILAAIGNLRDKRQALRAELKLAVGGTDDDDTEVES